MWLHLFETELGWIGLCGEERRIKRLALGTAEPDEILSRWQRELGTREFESAAESSGSCQERFVGEVERLIRGYLREGRPNLKQIPVVWPARTSFQSRVLQACRDIPLGETRTYQELAQAAGSPKASRAVGNVMAQNVLPLLIPCHRVVPRQGGLGGFSAPQGVALKQRLLELEAEAIQGLASVPAANFAS